VHAIVGLEDGHAPVRVARVVLGRAGLAGEEVDGHGLVLDAELAKRDARLEGVARRRVVVELHRPDATRVRACPNGTSS
jgi:hypothetical protein